MLTLRPMNEEEFLAWRKHSRQGYIAEHVKNGLSEADATARADRSFERNFPRGLHSPEQHVYTLVESGASLGVLWWGPSPDHKNVAWIYDIELNPAARGKGYGRQAMALAEADVAAKGFKRLGLHVFGHNEVAQKLYRSRGFAATNVIMHKDL